MHYPRIWTCVDASRKFPSRRGLEADSKDWQNGPAFEHGKRLWAAAWRPQRKPDAKEDAGAQGWVWLETPIRQNGMPSNPDSQRDPGPHKISLDSENKKKLNQLIPLHALGACKPLEFWSVGTFLRVSLQKLQSLRHAGA